MDKTATEGVREFADMWKELKLKESSPPTEENPQPAGKTLEQTTEESMIKVSCRACFGVSLSGGFSFSTIEILISVNR